MRVRIKKPEKKKERNERIRQRKIEERFQEEVEARGGDTLAAWTAALNEDNEQTADIATRIDRIAHRAIDKLMILKATADAKKAPYLEYLESTTVERKRIYALYLIRRLLLQGYLLAFIVTETFRICKRCIRCTTSSNRNIACSSTE